MKTPFAKPMTAPNRWYQLSMLQILVAMAVVSLVVWLNRPVPYRIDFDEGGTMPLGDSQGWPFNFRPLSWPLIPVILTPQQANLLPKNTVKNDITVLPLMIDITLGSLMITGSLILVGKFTQRAR